MTAVVMSAGAFMVVVMMVVPAGAFMVMVMMVVSAGAFMVVMVVVSAGTLVFIVLSGIAEAVGDEHFTGFIYYKKLLFNIYAVFNGGLNIVNDIGNIHRNGY